MQISPVLRQDFIWERVSSKKYTQLNTLKYAKGTQAYAWNFFQLPHFSICVMSQTPVHLILQLPTWFQVTFLLLLARSPPDTTSTSKLQVFFKVKCHIYYSRHVFLSHSTCVKLCSVYQVHIFIWNLSLMMLWVLGPWLIFLISPTLCFYVFKCNCACRGGF